MGQRTPLYDLHLALGAKMVDFGGWDMPLHYGSQVEEHHQVRRDCGVFDVSHMTVIDVGGSQAKAWLQHLLTNDVERLHSSGRALYSAMLNEQGGIVDDMIVYRLDDGYRLVVNASTRNQDLAWMQAHLDGLEIILPANQAPGFFNDLVGAGISPIGLGARDTLRVEAGMNLYGQDIDLAVSPLTSNMAWSIAWEPVSRQFIGRTALEAEQSGGIQHKLVGLVLEERGVLRAHQVVRIADVGEGEITSGSFSPTLSKSIALARVPMATADRAEVEIRGKWYPVRVVKPTFVRHGKTLI